MSMMAGPTGMSAGNRMSGAGDVIPKGFQKGQLRQFTPEQMQLFQQMFGQVAPGGFLSKLAGGDQSQFDALEAPAKRQFGEFQGELASRFSGLGMGARRSSGFNLAANQGAADFAQQLQSQRMGIQRQALMDLMGISESLLGQRPNERFLVENQQKPMSFLKQLTLGLAGGLPQAAAMPFMGAFGRK